MDRHSRGLRGPILLRISQEGLCAGSGSGCPYSPTAKQRNVCCNKTAQSITVSVTATNFGYLWHDNRCLFACPLCFYKKNYGGTKVKKGKDYFHPYLAGLRSDYGALCLFEPACGLLSSGNSSFYVCVQYCFHLWNQTSSIRPPQLLFPGLFQALSFIHPHFLCPVRFSLSHTLSQSICLSLLR